MIIPMFFYILQSFVSLLLESLLESCVFHVIQRALTVSFTFTV